MIFFVQAKKFYNEEGKLFMKCEPESLAFAILQLNFLLGLTYLWSGDDNVVLQVASSDGDHV